MDDLENGPLQASDQLTPVSAVWPMGFSWSSLVAQYKLRSICHSAGLTDDQLLALDSPHPICQEELVTIATDDALFLHLDPDAARKRLAAFDQSMLAHDVERNTTKDVDLADGMFGLGCNISNNPPYM